ELRLELAGDVLHQIEVDALLNQRVARPEKVLDGVERLDDLRFDAGLFTHFAQRGRFRGLALADRAFRQTPARAIARGDERDVRKAVADGDHGTAGGMLAARFPPRRTHS